MTSGTATISERLDQDLGMAQIRDVMMTRLTAQAGSMSA